MKTFGVTLSIICKDNQDSFIANISYVHLSAVCDVTPKEVEEEDVGKLLLTLAVLTISSRFLLFPLIPFYDSAHVLVVISE